MSNYLYKEYAQDVVETVSEGIMIVNPQGEILFVNEAFEKMTFFTKEELIGKTCDVLGCSTCFGSMAQGGDKYCALFKKGSVKNLRCTFSRKDGSRVSVKKNATTFKDSEGNMIGGVESLADLTSDLEKENIISKLRQQLNHEDYFQGMLGRSQTMQKVFAIINSAAESDAPVIIYGESGTGKELVASAIHRLSSRRSRPFIKVNCAALNENLLESELFGHVKGAFTGADRTRIGRFEAAQGGDVFLDEIGDIPLVTQTKLLRVLQEKEIERVGDHQPIDIDLRILAATNKSLRDLIEQGNFREDLFYRINVIPIELPPLRERLEDIPLLTEVFIDRIGTKSKKNISGISKKSLDLFMNYSWPGNIRELINAIEYAFVLCPGEEITPDYLPNALTGATKMSRRITDISPITLDKKTEQKNIIKALKTAGGNKTKAAELLGISRVTLWKRLKTYGKESPEKGY